MVSGLLQAGAGARSCRGQAESSHFTPVRFSQENALVKLNTAL